MNFPSTSSSQAGFTKSLPQRAFNNQREVGLKTSNPDIFPSLHPLSNFYRQSKTNTVTTNFAGHNEPQEPVKKLKVENGQKTVVSHNNNVEYSRTTIREENKNNKIAKTSEQDVFRVPKLPKRLLDKKNKELEENMKNEFAQRLQGFQSIGGESCVDPNMFAQNNQSQIPFAAVEKNTNRVNQELDPVLLSALYEKLKIEYYNFQLRQSLMNMYQLNQQNMLQNLQRMQGAYAGF